MCPTAERTSSSLRPEPGPPSSSEQFAADKAAVTVLPHEAQYLNNQGFASSPSRFAFSTSALSTINGIDGHRAGHSVRRHEDRQRLETTLPGLQGRKPDQGNGAQGMLQIDGPGASTKRIASFAGYHDEYSPYMFNSERKFVGRLPTEPQGHPPWHRIPRRTADVRDFNHFIFGSSEGQGRSSEKKSQGWRSLPVLSPPGSGRLTTTTWMHAVTIISKLANGNNTTGRSEIAEAKRRSISRALAEGWARP